MSKQLQGYINLTIIILGKKYAEDLLPIRECDIQAIDEAIASSGKAKLINKLFGFDGGKVHDLDEIERLQHVSNLTKAMRTLRRTTKLEVFGKLSRSFLEEQLAKKNKVIDELRNANDETGKLFRQSAMLNRINTDNMQYGSSEQREAYKFIIHNISDASIDALCFTVRTNRCLKEAGVKTIKDLVRKTAEELLALPQFGRKSFYEVTDFLNEAGLELAKEPWAIVSQRPDDHKMQIY